MKKLLIFLTICLIAFLSYFDNVKADEITDSRLLSYEKVLAKYEGSSTDWFYIFDGNDIYLKYGEKNKELTRYDIPGFNLASYPYFVFADSGSKLNYFWYCDTPMKIYERSSTFWLVHQNYAYNDGTYPYKEYNNVKFYWFDTSSKTWKTNTSSTGQYGISAQAKITNNYYKIASSWYKMYTNHEVYYSNTGTYSVADEKALTKNINMTPTLNYKTSFNSGTNAKDMSKITVEFDEADSGIIHGKIKFKLQFGSNDFTRENIPIYSHYKLYGSGEFGTSDKNWEEINQEQEYIFNSEDDPFYFKFTDYNYTYDYNGDTNPGIGTNIADASVSFDFTIPKNVTIYTHYKIEFYFDNTNNYWLYVYDSLKNSDWKDVPNYLEDNVFYYFPPQYRYAFISSDKEENTGKIFFPTNHIENPTVRLGAFRFKYNTNTVSDKLEIKLLEQEDYYSYVNIDFKAENKECIVLSRKKSQKYYSYYDPDFLHKWLKVFPDEKLIQDSEMSYIYVPKGYKVTFATEIDQNVSIMTPDGWINLDMNLIFDNNDYSEFDKDNSNPNKILDYFSNLTSIDENISDLIKNVWNSLKESRISLYITTLIVSTLVILIISAINRQ